MANSADTKDREIIMSRLIDAPRDLVWEAMTKPEHVVHWWGPNGFTNTLQKLDFRDPKAKFEAIWTFEAVDAQTKVTIHLLFPNAQARNMAVEKSVRLKEATKPWRALPATQSKFRQ